MITLRHTNVLPGVDGTGFDLAVIEDDGRVIITIGIDQEGHAVAVRVHESASVHWEPISKHLTITQPDDVGVSP